MATKVRNQKPFYPYKTGFYAKQAMTLRDLIFEEYIWSRDAERLPPSRPHILRFNQVGIGLALQLRANIAVSLEIAGLQITLTHDCSRRPRRAYDRQFARHRKTRYRKSGVHAHLLPLEELPDFGAQLHTD